MAKKVVEQKLITVNSAGTITELGGISGPVLNPCYVPIPTITALLNHHRVVYEVNPKNYNEKIRLSLKTLTKKNFTSEDEAPITSEKLHLAPNIFTEATVKNSNASKTHDMKTENDMVVMTKPAPTTAPKAKTEAVTVDKKEETKVEKTTTPTSDFSKTK